MDRRDPTDVTHERATAGTEFAVPGSISNLGPGLDALSVAVQLYLRLRIVEVRPEAPDTIDWEFVDAPPAGENRIDTAFRLARARVGAAAPGLGVQVQSEIPQGAGLGSSAAAAVAGLLLYEAVTTPRPPGEWLGMAAELEGHPDNAAATLHGGLTVSCTADDGRVLARSTRWPEDVRLVVATPGLSLQTPKSRRVLPTSVPLGDAVFNLQRALLLVRALETGRYEDVRESMRDRWHQPARARLVPGLTEAMAIHDPAVLGVCLSGAGPSIVALATDGAARAATLLGEVYDRLGVPVTMRILSAHQPRPISDEAKQPEAPARP